MNMMIGEVKGPVNIKILGVDREIDARARDVETLQRAWSGLNQPPSPGRGAGRDSFPKPPLMVLGLFVPSAGVSVVDGFFSPDLSFTI